MNYQKQNFDFNYNCIHKPMNFNYLINKNV